MVVMLVVLKVDSLADLKVDLMVQWMVDSLAVLKVN